MKILIEIIIVGLALILNACLFFGPDELDIRPGYYNIDEYNQIRLDKSGEFESRIYQNHFYGSSKPSDSGPSAHYKGKWRVSGGKYETKLDSMRMYNEPITIENPNPKIGWSDWKKVDGGFDAGEEIVSANGSSFTTQNCIYGMNFENKTECFKTTWNMNSKKQFIIPSNCVGSCDYSK